MKPLAFFAFVVISILGVVALAQVTFVQDLITKSGFTPGEVWSGTAAILLVFYAMLAVTVK